MITGVLDGFSEEQVIGQLTLLFKTTDTEIRSRLDRSSFVVKKGVDFVTAAKYKAALEQHGCVVDIQPEADPHPQSVHASMTGSPTIAHAPTSTSHGRPLTSTSVKQEETLSPGTSSMNGETAEFALAGRWHRLSASFIDTIILIAFVIPAVLFIFNNEGLRLLLPPFIIEEVAPYVLSVVIFTMLNGFLLKKSGQTIGKKIVGIKIVNLDDELPGLSVSLGRRFMLFSLLNAIPKIGPVIWIADSLFIFRSDRRCLHDLVASTKVVLSRPKQLSALWIAVPILSVPVIGILAAIMIPAYQQYKARENVVHEQRARLVIKDEDGKSLATAGSTNTVTVSNSLNNSCGNEPLNGVWLQGIGGSNSVSDIVKEIDPEHQDIVSFLNKLPENTTQNELIQGIGKNPIREPTVFMDMSSLQWEIPGANSTLNIDIKIYKGCVYQISLFESKNGNLTFYHRRNKLGKS